MDHPESPHPDLKQLRAYGQGRLNPVEAVPVAQHLAGCDACRLIAARFTSAGGSAPPDEPPQKPADVEPPVELIDHPRYQVTEYVNTRGLLTTYRAEHRLMQRTVFLKVLDLRLTTNAGDVARFHNEARAAARLAHGNILAARDADQAGNLHFLVTEFAAGKPLAQIVASRGWLPFVNACNYVRQAAAGLRYAAEHGAVHHALDPAALLLTPEGSVKLLDFGVGKFLADSVPGVDFAPTVDVVPNPECVAPEQVQDPRAADPRADIYALGCILYHLLAGKAPFADAPRARKLRDHRETPPRPLHELRSEVPPELERIIERMMAKDREKRFATPVEVVQALEPFAKRDAIQVLSAAGPQSKDPAGSSRLPVASQRPAEPEPPFAITRHAPTHPPRNAPILGIVAEDKPLPPPIPLVATRPEAPSRPAARKPVAAKHVDEAHVLAGGFFRNNPALIAVGITAILVAAVVVPFLVSEFSGGSGELVLKSDVPGVRLVITQRGKHVQTVDAVDGKRVSLPTGEYDLELKDGPKDAWLTQTRVKLERNERHSLRIRQTAPEADAVAEAEPPKKPRGLPENRIAPPLPDRPEEKPGPDPERPRAPIQKGAPPRGTRPGIIESPNERPQDRGMPPFSKDKQDRIGPRGEKDEPKDRAAPPGVAEEQGDELRQFNGHTGPVRGVAFAPTDGKTAVSVGSDGAVIYWHVGTGGEIRRFAGHTGAVLCVAFTPNGRGVVTGGEDETVRLWEVATGSELAVFRGHRGQVTCVAVTPDSRFAVTGALDGSVRVWSLDKGTLVGTWEVGPWPVPWVIVSSDGRNVVSGHGDKNMRVWVMGQPQASLAPMGDTQLNAAAGSRDGSLGLFAATDHTLRIWRYNGKKLSEASKLVGHADEVLCVAVSPDGRRGLSGSGSASGKDNSLRLWDLGQTRQVQRFVGHTGAVHSVAFSPDGKHALSGSADKTVRLWRLPGSGQTDE